MQNKSFLVDILTPYDHYLHQEVDYLSVKTGMGEIGILPGHAPLITTIEISGLVLKFNGTASEYAVSGGVLNIKKGTHVSLLVNSIERSDEIDVKRAEDAKKRAEQRLNEEGIDVARARASLARATNRINISKK